MSDRRHAAERIFGERPAWTVELLACLVLLSLVLPAQQGGGSGGRGSPQVQELPVGSSRLPQSLRR